MNDHNNSEKKNTTNIRIQMQPGIQSISPKNLGFGNLNIYDMYKTQNITSQNKYHL